MLRRDLLKAAAAAALYSAVASVARADSGPGGGRDDRDDDRGRGRGRGRGGDDDNERGGGSSSGHGSIEERAAALGDGRADRANERLREDVRRLEFQDRLIESEQAKDAPTEQGQR